MAGADRYYAARRLGLLSTSALAVLISSTAFAQSDTPTAQVASKPDGSSGLSDIIVTATRRATNVQDVPSSITAVGGAELASQGIASAMELARVAPNILVTNGYSPGNVRVAIRGLGSTDFSPAGGSPVGISFDDVFQPYSFGLGSQLFDVDRVEILRGPQGTLFGKNTTAGVVSYYSARPTDQTEGYFNVDGGFDAFDTAAIEGAYNMPLTSNLNMRASIRSEIRRPYINVVNTGGTTGESNVVSGRVQFAWRPGGDTKINLKLFAMNSSGDGPIFHGQYLSNLCDPANFSPAETPYVNCSGTTPVNEVGDYNSVFSEVDTYERYHNYGATLHIDQSLGDWDLTAISSYLKIKYKVAFNDDGMSTDIFRSLQFLDGWNVSQELRVASPTDGFASTIIGLYGQFDKANQPNSGSSVLLGPPYDFSFRYQSKQSDLTLAAFGSVTANLSDALSIVGGARYTWERKKVFYESLSVFDGVNALAPFEQDLASYPILNPPFPLLPGDTYESVRRRDSWSRLTWDLAVNFKPTGDSLLYVKAAEGFKSGGYNLTASNPSAFSTVDPEIIRSYEVGFKTEWFDRRLRVNGSAYHYKFTNQQIQTTGANGFGVQLSNAGRSTIKGFEVEVDAAPLPGLSLNASVGYADARFDRFDTLLSGSPVSLAGNRLAFAPKWSVTWGGHYDATLSNRAVLQFQSDWSYRTRVYFDSYNFDYTSDTNRMIGNARITYTPAEANWHIAAYVKNLTNEKYYNFGYFVGSFFAANAYADARIIGGQVGFKF